MVLKVNQQFEKEEHREAIQKITKKFFDQWQQEIEEYIEKYGDDANFTFSCYADPCLNFIIALTKDYHARGLDNNVAYQTLLANYHGATMKAAEKGFEQYHPK